MALLVLVVIALMGSTLVYVGTHNLDQIHLSGRQNALRHTADGGLHELLDAIYQNPEYGQDQTATGTGLYSGSEGSTRYSWTFNPSAATPYCTNNLEGEDPVAGYQGRTVPPGCALLFVAARFEDSERNQESLILGSMSTNRFPYAIASDGKIEVADVSSLIPGYGNLLSNKVGGDPNIEAGVVDGTTFSRDGEGSIEVSAGSGPTMYDQPPVGLPNLPIQDIVASWSTAGVSGAHPFGGPAQYQFDDDVSASTDSDGNITIDGVEITPPATVYVDGDITIGGGADIAQGLHIFCTGNFRVNGALNQVVASLDHTRYSLASRKKVTPTPSPSPDPEVTPSPSPVPLPTPSPGASPVVSTETNFIFSCGDIRFNGGSAQSIDLLCVDGILQNGSSNLKGIFYVQNGDLRITGKSQLTGVVVTRSGQVAVEGEVDSGNTDVTYDPSVLSKLIALNTSLLGRMRASSWWIEQ